jgi:polyisoprenoid-binding protein YceI
MGACWLLLPLGLAAQTPHQWSANGADGELSFLAYYEGAPITGHFRTFIVSASQDSEDAGAAPTRIAVEVDITSATMGAADIDQAISGGEWFDSSGFPRASFATEAIEAAGDTGYHARGTLALKGHRQRIEVPFTWTRQGPDAALLQGEVALQRLDFGIGTGEWARGDAIGLQVLVRFQLTLHPDE